MQGQRKSKTGLNYTVNESFEDKTFRLILMMCKMTERIWRRKKNKKMDKV